MDALCGVILITGFVCLIMAAFMVKFNSKTSTATVWEKFGRKYNLNINPGELLSLPSITGNYKGFPYVLNTTTEGDTHYSSIYTIITLTLPEFVDYHIEISQEKFLSKAGKMAGCQDIQTGNKSFDDAFIVQSRTPSKVTDLLNSELQRKMLNGQFLINISLSGKKVSNKVIGAIEEEQNLLYISEILWELAMNACGKNISEVTGNTQTKKELASDFTGEINE